MANSIKDKMKQICGISLVGLGALQAGCSAAPDLEQQVDELYGKMTNEERIAQLRSMYMDELFDAQGTARHGQVPRTDTQWYRPLLAVCHAAAP